MKETETEDDIAPEAEREEKTAILGETDIVEEIGMMIEAGKGKGDMRNEEALRE